MGSSLEPHRCYTLLPGPQLPALLSSRPLQGLLIFASLSTVGVCTHASPWVDVASDSGLGGLRLEHLEAGAFNCSELAYLVHGSLCFSHVASGGRVALH